MFTRAITRKPGRNFADGITTALIFEPPDYNLILQQHAAYVEALKSIGLDVVVLDPLPEHPDAHFVEDTAVVTADIAVITNPGADARKGEEESIARVLAEYREVERIQAPGIVDGGDVLQVGDHFFIGLSERTNKAGAGQLGRILQKYGNSWTTVPVEAGLHFKSSVNYVGQNTLLVTDSFARHEMLNAYDRIIVAAGESYAANTLFINDRLLMPRGFPATRKKLEKLSLKIIELETSEVRKMDGGLTCLSLRF
jgi:dimethylargininase